MNKLLPCPWCGSAPKRTAYAVYCDNPKCPATPYISTNGKWTDSSSESLWNIRMRIPPPLAGVTVWLGVFSLGFALACLLISWYRIP